MASLALAIAISAPAAAQVDAGNEQLMNLVLQMQQLQDEIRSLRGQVEEQAYQIEDLKRRQRDQYLDLDQRISEFSSAGPAAAVTTSPGTTDIPEIRPPADTPTVSTAEAPEVRGAIDARSDVTAIAAPDTTSRTMQATPEMEQEAYDQAFQALKELRYADAAQYFQDFLANYPNSDYADNAQYWLGESYYVTRNYDLALAAFEELQRAYPDSTKAGDGLLKIGFTHYELKQYDQARAALEQVQQRFPDSTLARLAENRLRSMRLEGHL